MTQIDIGFGYDLPDYQRSDKYGVCVSESAYPNFKPKGKERFIRQELARPKSRKKVTARELMDIIKAGHTILLGDFSGGTKACNWVSQRLFALDFDNNRDVKSKGFNTLSPLDAIDFAYSYKLDPILLYFTWSSTMENPRFRIIFDSGTTYTSIDQAEAYASDLVGKFPEADPCSKRLAQMYFSGNGEVWAM